MYTNTQDIQYNMYSTLLPRGFVNTFNFWRRGEVIIHNSRDVISEPFDSYEGGIFEGKKRRFYYVGP